MEPERILGFEDQSRAAAEAARDERIGKVQKSDVEEAVIDCICKFTHWGAKQIAKRMGVTPAFVQQVKVKYAAEIKRRCGITVRRPIVNFESTEETVVEKDGTEKRVVKQEPMPNGMVHVFTEKVEDDVPHQSAEPTASPLGSQGETEDVNFVLMSDDVPEETLAHDMKVTFGDVARAFGRLSGEPENVVRHRTLCNYLNTLYARKNADYGDSFHKLFEEEGMASSRIRLTDKLNRFKRLSRNYEQNVKGESIRDTLMDMANYAIMTIMEIDRNGGK